MQTPYNIFVIALILLVVHVFAMLSVYDLLKWQMHLMKKMKDKCCLLNVSFVDNESGERCKGNDCAKVEKHNRPIII